MTSDSVVVVDDVHKKFRLYRERNRSLKAMVLRRNRAKYEEFWALRGVTLEVPQGSTFGLIGENGSGKSTLLKCMAQILRPDRGTVRTVGKVSALLELGAGFHEELSGRENVFLNGSILGMSQRQLEARFDSIVEFAGLEKFIDQPVKNYSSGMYIRLGFSVAINVDPDILLVDEVLAVGDEQFQRRCNERFSELKEQGTTVVLVSHGMGAIRSMCDRAAWLEHGELRHIGPSGEVVDAYLETVHEDREDTDGGTTRWGSGELRIDQVELVGPDGAPNTRVRTGDDVAIRVSWHADQPVAKPVFSIVLTTVDGHHVSGPSTRDHDLVPDEVNGSGTTVFSVADLRLLPGTYDLAVEATDVGGLHIYDHHHRALRFDVEIGRPHELGGGIVSLAGRWQYQ